MPQVSTWSDALDQKWTLVRYLLLRDVPAGSTASAWTLQQFLGSGWDAPQQHHPDTCGRVRYTGQQLKIRGKAFLRSSPSKKSKLGLAVFFPMCCSLARFHRRKTRRQPIHTRAVDIEQLYFNLHARWFSRHRQAFPSHEQLRKNLKNQWNICKNPHTEDLGEMRSSLFRTPHSTIQELKLSLLVFSYCKHGHFSLNFFLVWLGLLPISIWEDHFSLHLNNSQGLKLQPTQWKALMTPVGCASGCIKGKKNSAQK